MKVGKLALEVVLGHLDVSERENRRLRSELADARTVNTELNKKINEHLQYIDVLKKEIEAARTSTDFLSIDGS